MKLRPHQWIGLGAMLVFGSLLVVRLVVDRRPRIHLPPPMHLTYEHKPLPLPELTPPPVTQEELEELKRKVEALSKPLPPPPPAPVTPPPAPEPPPPPAFRASKPGADKFQPIPFPPNPTEPYTKEGFTKNMELALKECFMDGAELLSVDCAEFPCMALTELKSEAARQANLNSCAFWHGPYKRGTQYVSSIQKRDGQEVHYMSWVPLPPHDADAKLVMLRSTRRAKAMVKALAPR